MQGEYLPTAFFNFQTFVFPIKGIKLQKVVPRALRCVRRCTTRRLTGQRLTPGSRRMPSILPASAPLRTLQSSAPLRTISPFLQRSDSPASVPVRLTEPLFHSGERVELLVHCVQLHVLLERAEALAADAGGDLSLEEVCDRTPRIRSLLTGLSEASQALQPGPPLLVLEETGLASMCPVVAHVLGDDADEAHRDEGVLKPNEYLEHVTAVNQLACTARQLRRDVSGGHVKYAAHKVALLYHAVNLSKVHREVLRKRIEEHFEDIKIATDPTAEAPGLSPELVSWLVELCDEVLRVISTVPPSILSKLQPLQPLLQPCRSPGASGRASRSSAADPPSPMRLLQSRDSLKNLSQKPGEFLDDLLRRCATCGRGHRPPQVGCCPP